MGVYEHKVIKNRFASDLLLEYILPLRTCGVLREDPVRRVRELAVPMGVVGAIIPTTNPTSTAIYKALIAIKARNAIVMSPHPRAVGCTVEAGRILDQAARAAGAPAGLVNVMTAPTLEGTNALMRHGDIAVLLATGGADMVRAVYTAGKPAYGVGPGNVPAIVERTADVAKAVRDVVDGKTFDAGVLCSSENSVVVDRPIAGEVRARFAAEGAHFCTAGQKRMLERYMIPASDKEIVLGNVMPYSGPASAYGAIGKASIPTSSGSNRLPSRATPAFRSIHRRVSSSSNSPRSAEPTR